MLCLPEMEQVLWVWDHERDAAWDTALAMARQAT